jgi:hypothetical protein
MLFAYLQGISFTGSNAYRLIAETNLAERAQFPSWRI